MGSEYSSVLCLTRNNFHTAPIVRQYFSLGILFVSGNTSPLCDDAVDECCGRHDELGD